MTLGFIVLRHVRHRVNDFYWKESYRCIRRWYPDAPILLIDDGSHPDHLKEDLMMTRCTVVYSNLYRGAAELLPYYYFYHLRPFDTAVVLHDGVFLQAPLLGVETMTEKEGIRWLWSIPHTFDYTITREIHELMRDLPGEEAVRQCYADTGAWSGAFGVMSVIAWSFLDRLQMRFSLFDRILSKLKTREDRSALERVFGVLAHQLRREEGNPQRVEAMHGNILEYMTWGVSFVDYVMREDLHDAARYPLVKVWSGR